MSITSFPQELSALVEKYKAIEADSALPEKIDCRKSISETLDLESIDVDLEVHELKHNLAFRELWK